MLTLEVCPHLGETFVKVTLREEERRFQEAGCGGQGLVVMRAGYCRGVEVGHTRLTLKRGTRETDLDLVILVGLAG